MSTVYPLSIEKIGNLVRISYFSPFDIETHESDSFCMDFSLSDYQQAIKDLQKQGECSISGSNCSLRIRKGAGLEIFLSQNTSNVSLSIEDLPELLLEK